MANIVLRFVARGIGSVIIVAILLSGIFAGFVEQVAFVFAAVSLVMLIDKYLSGDQKTDV